MARSRCNCSYFENGICRQWFTVEDALKRMLICRDCHFSSRLASWEHIPSFFLLLSVPLPSLAYLSGFCFAQMEELQLLHTMSYGPHKLIFMPVKLFHHPLYNTENFWSLSDEDQIGEFNHLSKI